MVIILVVIHRPLILNFAAYYHPHLVLIISAVVVVDSNEAIGFENGLLCNLPNDLKRFKAVTSGHHILMGRKTFESIGKPLPGRTNMILSHNHDLQLEGCSVFHDITSAINFAKAHGETELMLIGGSKVYELMQSYIDKIYYTRIHHAFEQVDAHFPKFDLTNWELVEQQFCEKDEKNPFDHTFETWVKQ